MLTEFLLVLLILVIAVYIFMIIWSVRVDFHDNIVTYSELGQNGRFGNQLFQIASVIGHAEYGGYRYGFPKWDYSQYFKEELPVENLRPNRRIGEKCLIKYEPIPNIGGIDLTGFRQTEHYFSHIRHKIEKQFKFNDGLVDYIKEKLNPDGKRILGIHYRLGDYDNNPDFQVCTPRYYLSAIEHFRMSREFDEIILFSDEPRIAVERLGIQCRISPFKSEIEDFIGLMLCDYRILSNSTFSWWTSYLSPNKPKSIYEYNDIAPTPWFGPNNCIQVEDPDIYRSCWKLLDGRSGEAVESKFEKRIEFIDKIIEKSIPEIVKLDYSMNAPVFVISMDDVKLENATRELTLAGFLNINHFKAVVGKEYDRDVLEDLGIISKKFSFREEHYVNMSSVIGCFMSHFVLSQWMIKNDLDKVLIFEDDIVYNKYLDDPCARRLVKTLEQIEGDWLYLYLGGCLTECDKLRKVKHNLYNTSSSLCCHSYIMSRKGAELLSAYLPAHANIDTFIDDCFKINEEENIDSWYIFYPSFFYQDVKQFQSTSRPKDYAYLSAQECR